MDIYYFFARLFLILLIPLGMLVLPIVAMLIFSKYCIRKAWLLQMIIAFGLTACIEYYFTMWSFDLSAFGTGYGLEPVEFRCVQGSVIFILLGYALTFVVVPILGIIYTFIYFKKQKS